MAAKIVVALLSMFVLFLVSLATMIYGWGVHPQSWGWIIGGYFATLVITVGLQIVSNSKD